MSRPEKPPETEFAKRLRAVRQRIGVADRAEFASKLGVPVSTYATWERGKNEPPATALAAYAWVFGVSLIWLVTGEGEMFSSLQSNNVGTALLDRDVMQIAIEAVEEGLAGRPFPADKKAKLILAGYDLILKDRTNRDNVVLFARVA